MISEETGGTSCRRGFRPKTRQVYIHTTGVSLGYKCIYDCIQAASQAGKSSNLCSLVRGILCYLHPRLWVMVVGKSHVRVYLKSKQLNRNCFIAVAASGVRGLALLPYWLTE